MTAAGPFFFDTHCHPAVPPKTEEVDYVAAAAETGVKFLMLTAADLTASRHYAEIAASHDNCWFAAGVHPHDAESVSDNPPEAFEAFRDHPKLAAVGEIGLDYFHNFSEHGPQRKVFEYFLGKALEWKRPAILHCRDKQDRGPAYDDMLPLLRDFAKDSGRFVMHCFAGTLDFAETCYELGGYIGITGIVTFNYGDNIREIVRRAPAERLLLETDSPYLAPVPFRGKPNHPRLIPHIASKVAEVRGISVDAVAQLTTNNAFTLFRLPQTQNPYAATQ